MVVAFEGLTVDADRGPPRVLRRQADHRRSIEAEDPLCGRVRVRDSPARVLDDETFTERVDHDGLDGPAVQRTLPHHLHVLAALAEVDRDRHDLAAGLLADPADRDRGVESAGVGQDDALGHVINLLVVMAY